MLTCPHCSSYDFKCTGRDPDLDIYEYVCDDCGTVFQVEESYSINIISEPEEDYDVDEDD